MLRVAEAPGALPLHPSSPRAKCRAGHGKTRCEEGALLGHLATVLMQYGYPFVFLVLFAESLAVPAPSEFTLVTAGVLAGQGHMALWGIVVVGALGSTTGAVLAFFIGKRGGRLLILRYGRYVGLNEDRLHSVEKFFRRRGAGAIVVGRIISGVRAVISYPAGMFDMPFVTFLAATILGAAIWPLLAAGAGNWIGQHWALLLRFASHYWPLLSAVAVLVAIAVIARRRRAARPEEGPRDER